jgi:outer membrane protein OmpA-like peptidoglycan-associated protein
MKKLVCLIMVFAVIGSVVGQEKFPYKKGRTLGLHFTQHDFQTAADLKSMSLASVFDKGEWNDLQRMNPGLALSYSDGITDHLDVMARFGYSEARYRRPNSTSPPSTSGALLEADVSLLAKLTSERYWVSPYLSLGVGGSQWRGYYAAYIPAGLGLQFNFNDQYLVLQSQYRFAVTGNAAPHLFYSLGFATRVGKKKEAAKVVAPPPPPVVEAPKDSDGDGIPDKDDACPTVAGKAQFKGCPDTDGDGIPDAEDACPTVAGIARFKGCPDTDGDGIPDSEDKCPTVAGIARYNGCPIPDTDGDGINDEEDKCPTIPGVRENAGCPKIDFNARNVQFVTGSATLTTGAKAELDKLVNILNNQYTDVNILIEGHTDNVGKPESNQILSEKRAAAVRAYLVSKKVNQMRLTPSGFGQDRPIADNATAEGRAQNRRVEFRVSQ